MNLVDNFHSRIKEEQDNVGQKDKHAAYAANGFYSATDFIVFAERLGIHPQRSAS